MRLAGDSGHERQSIDEESLLPLFRTFRRTNDVRLRDRLFLSTLEIVKTEAGRFLLHVPPVVERGDLEAAAAAGLLQAVERFDPESGVPFRYFASLRVRGAILDELRRMDLLGRDTRKRVEAIRAAEARLKNKGLKASDEAIAEEAGLSYEEYADAEMAFHASRLVQVTEEDDGAAVPVPWEGPLPADQVQNEELVGKAMENLSEREKALVTLHYYEGLTLREISRAMGLSEGRVSQIHSEMLRRLKRLLD